MKILLFLLIGILITLLINCSGSGPLISSGEIFKNITKVTFSEDEDRHPDLSSDRKKILYFSDRDGNDNIYLKNDRYEKSDIQKTNHSGSDTHPCFSNDDERFVFASDRNGNYDIFIMNTERGFAATQISNSSDDEFLPSWSPTEDKIAFTQYSSRDGEYYIWIKDLDNGQLAQICNGLYSRFSPDGKQLYYKKTSGGYYQLWKIDLDGEYDTQLTTGDDWGIGTFTIKPDGSKIMYSSSRYAGTMLGYEDGSDLWVIDLKYGDQIQVTTHKGSDYDPVWSVDDNIYFASDRGGNVDIWFFNSEL